MDEMKEYRDNTERRINSRRVKTNRRKMDYKKPPFLDIETAFMFLFLVGIGLFLWLGGLTY